MNERSTFAGDVKYRFRRGRYHLRGWLIMSAIPYLGRDRVCEWGFRRGWIQSYDRDSIWLAPLGPDAGRVGGTWTR